MWNFHGIGLNEDKDIGRFSNLHKCTFKRVIAYAFVSLKSNFRMSWIRATKVPFNFHFKIEMKKDIFVHFNFDLKIKNWKMIKNFQFSFFNFYWKIENRKFIFHVLIFEFNCQITQVDKSWLAFLKISLALYLQKRKKKLYCNPLKRVRYRNSN